jgi:hypothetical protein
VPCSTISLQEQQTLHLLSTPRRKRHMVKTTSESCTPRWNHEMAKPTNFSRTYIVSDFMTLTRYRYVPPSRSSVSSSQYHPYNNNYNSSSTPMFQAPAICEFGAFLGSFHLAHAQQQFLRCFSFWRHEDALVLPPLTLLSSSSRTVQEHDHHLPSPPHHHRIRKAILIWRLAFGSIAVQSLFGRNTTRLS